MRWEADVDADADADEDMAAKEEVTAMDVEADAGMVLPWPSQ